MTLDARSIATFCVRLLTMQFTITSLCWMFGAISLMLALVIGLLAATLAGDWFAETGYDLAVEGCASALNAFRGLRARLSA